MDEPRLKVSANLARIGNQGTLIHKIDKINVYTTQCTLALQEDIASLGKEHKRWSLLDTLFKPALSSTRMDRDGL